MDSPKPWRRLAVLETAAMFALITSYIWWWRGEFPGSSALVVALYFAIGVVSHATRHESARQLGLRLDNLRGAVRNAVLVVAPAVILAIAAGLVLKSWRTGSWSALAAQAAWLIPWGMAQQYGLLCFFYRRFLEIFGRPWAATIGASLTFAAVHVPNAFLLTATLAAGAASCMLYRREPNVFVLGVAHATISFVLLWALPESITHGLHVGPGYFASR